MGMILPGAVFAAPRTFTELADMITNLAGLIIPVLVLFAFAAFFFGLVKFLTSGDDTTKRKEGNMIMTWGIFSLFVIIAVWGIVAVVHMTFFGTERGGPVDGNIPEQIYGNM